MSESATNVCFRNGSPSPLRLGALATALSVCTTAEKKGMFTVPGDNRGNLSCFSVWSVSPWEWGLRREGRLPSLAVGSSLPAAHSCRHCLLPRSRSPYHRLLLPSHFSSPQHRLLLSVVLFMYGEVLIVILGRKRILQDSSFLHGARGCNFCFEILKETYF